MFRYYKGFISRLLLHIKYSIIRKIAIYRGAKIGNTSIIPYKLAVKANSNLVVGNDVIIESTKLDLRDKIIINDHVIVNKEVSIIRVSHSIDNDTFFSTKYYSPLVIHSYSWLATGCKILPSVQNISKGSIISAFSILVKDTEECGVYSGSPAILKRKHDTMFTDLIVVSLMGGDFLFYKKSRL